MALRIGFIGTGDERKPGRSGFGMAHSHARGYQRLAADVTMVACCDLLEERRVRFAGMYGIPQVYQDYQEMLAKEDLDVVSICTWPDSHCQLVLDTMAAGVKAIHCEKPMAFAWGECKQMVEASKEYGVMLTFNHQRRFGQPFRQAKHFLDEGRVGKLEAIGVGVGNIYDYGSHNWDMCSYFNDLVPVQWVIAQIEYHEESLFFGVHNENQAMVTWQYENGVYGQMATGVGQDLVGCHHRLIGSDGEIRIGSRKGGSILQLRGKGSSLWESIDCGGDDCHGPEYVEKAIADIVGAVKTGQESVLCATNALVASEPMFAAWESVRRRGRVELPLDIEDNPLEEMVREGVFQLGK